MKAAYQSKFPVHIMLTATPNCKEDGSKSVDISLDHNIQISAESGSFRSLAYELAINAPRGVILHFAREGHFDVSEVEMLFAMVYTDIRRGNLSPPRCCDYPIPIHLVMDTEPLRDNKHDSEEVTRVEMSFSHDLPKNDISMEKYYELAHELVTYSLYICFATLLRLNIISEDALAGEMASLSLNTVREMHLLDKKETGLFYPSDILFDDSIVEEDAILSTLTFPLMSEEEG